MITTKIEGLTSGKMENMKNAITASCQSRWGDSEQFISDLISKSDFIVTAYDDSALVGFAIAKSIFLSNSIAIAVFATRVLCEFRKQGIAQKMFRKLINHFILNEKLLKPLNWFKPSYFVSATANPIVYETLCGHLKLIPSPDSGKPSKNEIELAQAYADVFSSKNKFNERTFVLSGAFLNSAEFYPKDIPWSKSEKSNKYLEERLNLKERTGNGLIILSRLL